MNLKRIFGNSNVKHYGGIKNIGRSVERPIEAIKLVLVLLLIEFIVTAFAKKGVLEILNWTAPVMALVLLLMTVSVCDTGHKNDDAAIFGILGIVMALLIWWFVNIRLDHLVMV